jgi:hypothetical protein
MRLTSRLERAVAGDLGDEARGSALPGYAFRDRLRDLLETARNIHYLAYGALTRVV